MTQIDVHGRLERSLEGWQEPGGTELCDLVQRMLNGAGSSAQSLDLEEAAAALETVNADYDWHCRAAREIAAACFDAEQVVAQILNETFGSKPRSMNDPAPPRQKEILGV